MNTNLPIVIAYIPVLHKGYLNFLEKYSGGTLFLLGAEMLQELDHMRKDIRALPAEQMKNVITALKIFSRVEVLDGEHIEALQKTHTDFVLPDEDISQVVVEKYFANNPVTYDTIFLRWDKKKTLQEQQVEAAQTVTLDGFGQQVLQKTQEIAQKSADWWRRVGAAIVKDGQMLSITNNHHVPDPQQPYFDGDPRGNFHAGEYIELSTAMHAEAALIADAAKKGTSLEGTQMYVTTFPCPNCAKLIAYSGIKKVYFVEGYAMLDGESILKENGVEIIKVKIA